MLDRLQTSRKTMLNDCKSARNKALRLSVANHDEAENKVYRDYEDFFLANKVSWKTSRYYLQFTSLYIALGLQKGY